MSAPSSYLLPPQLRIVPRIAFSSILGTLASLVLFLLLRRLSGALATPLEFLPALLAGLVLAIGSWLLRRSTRSHRAITAATAITWLFVIAITLSNMDVLSILVLWLPVITAEALWRVVPHEVANQPVDTVSTREALMVAPLTDVVQQFTRIREDDVESISGSATMTFEPGEKTTTLHLAFSPPLGSHPQIEVESDADEVDVRATECRSYGARLEAKRRGNCEGALNLTIHFEACG